MIVRALLLSVLSAGALVACGASEPTVANASPEPPNRPRVELEREQPPEAVSEETPTPASVIDASLEEVCDPNAECEEDSGCDSITCAVGDVCRVAGLNCCGRTYECFPKCPDDIHCDEPPPCDPNECPQGEVCWVTGSTCCGETQACVSMESLGWELDWAHPSLQP